MSRVVGDTRRKQTSAEDAHSPLLLVSLAWNRRENKTEGNFPGVQLEASN
jgi:hypothetical protein